MRPLSLGKTLLGMLAAGVLLTNGCALPHAELRPPNVDIGRVSPAQFCPGDTVTASYNLTQEQPCVSRSGFDCATLQPTITMASTPMSFAPRTATAFAGNIDFTPAADSVDVSFTAASRGLTYPIVTMSGAQGFQIVNLVNNTANTRRITGEIMRTVNHGGMCAGSAPTHADGVLPGPPEVSANLRTRRICNSSTTPLRLTITGAPGEMVERDLMPGQCLDTGEPGVSPEVAMARTYSVRALTVDPMAQCGAVQGSTPPAPLQTTIALSCGM
ncbi:hypothetical protein [Lysobacter hankyongensis]|uniref:Uncharacterized protein n=1 Tax=Lysobacter hankyongensis TaxID=1176535 RepID=A0ABP9BIG0_9GAMM